MMKYIRSYFYYHKRVRKVLIVVIIAFISFFNNLGAQEHPPIINYPPNVYGADNQNWMLTQADDGTVYVANNRGLLSFNGAQWNLYPTPNETLMRGAKTVGEKIYTGAYMDFGFWEKNKNGALIYNSLSAQKQIVMVEDEHIWNIEKYKKYVIFQSLDRIYIYDTVTNDIESIQPKGKITRLFLVDEDLYFQVRNEGIYAIENGKTVLFNNSIVFKDNRIINIFKIKEKLVAVTATNGFYEFNYTAATEINFSNDSLLNEVNIYSAIKRKSGEVVLGTVENGIIQLGDDGEIIFKVKKGSGLSNNTALSLFEDQDENLWIGLDAGIDCINKSGPFNQYIDVSGALGTIYVSAVYNGYVYIGTNQGLFYKKENSISNFKRMIGTQGQVWNLSVIDDELFCGHNNGTYIINEDKSRLIVTIEGTWGVQKIPKHDNLLLQGNYDGLHVLEKVGNTWRWRNKIKDFVNSSKHFEIVDEGTVLVNHEYKGVFEIHLDKDYDKAHKVFKHTSVNIGEHSSLARLDENILYANKEGIYIYNKEDHSFKKEEILSNIFIEDTFVSGKLIEDTKSLWIFTTNHLIEITRDNLDGSFGINKTAIPLELRNTVEGYENFVRFHENEYLLGTSNGYIIVDMDQYNEKQYNIELNEIIAKDIRGEARREPLDEQGEFSAKLNNMSFSFNVPEYDKFLTTEYSYKLEGLYDQWSSWTTNAAISFDNLSYGDYTFMVKGRTGDLETNNVVDYEFTINRPWYLSNTFIILYILLTILLFAALNWFYKRYYRIQQELALDRSKRDMELKALETEKQIIQLNNTNLKQAIDARNRELAVSIMNMISKSKTLSNIKSALLKADKIEDIKDVVNILDKNIENKEDWNFFEKAFNHADKDFFRKVKDRHPSLTANDLKLCVYLRLNMSSKEIAPLLNISSRSVEIKRYRLRKKLELAREINLNDYFINL